MKNLLSIILLLNWFVMAAQVNENELIRKWTVFDTPHQTLKFSQYPTSEYLQAMRLAMKEHNKEIEKIKNNPEAPTFENTIVALEESGDMLSRIQYCFYNLLSAETNDELDSIAGEISPEETEHNNVIYQDTILFARVKAVYDKKESLNLSIEEKKLLEDTYESFENMGATLPADKQKEFSELSKQLSALTLQFQQNVLKSTNEYKLKVADVSQLSGLPQAILDAAKEEAKKDTFEGYVFTLKAPSYVPFMKYADNRELRKTIYLAYNSRSTSGDSNNIEVLRKITETRLKIANLLGYKCHADKILRHRMAEKKENVYNLLDELLAAYKPTALKEVEAVKNFAASYSIPVAQSDFQPWDWSYYSEKLREKEYATVPLE